MDVIQKIAEYAKDHDRIALSGEDGNLTYGQLEEYSNRLAAWICKYCQGNKDPVLVYGHKSIYMIVCFLAAVKSGRAYCPVDHSLPTGRVRQIIDKVEPSVIFDVESSLEPVFDHQVRTAELVDAAASYEETADPKERAAGTDVFYIIFTSGSSGAPKGVKITADCLNHYLEWSVTLGGSAAQKEGKRFLNQAPFSFDLSVMDIYTCLASGGTLQIMSRRIQEDYGLLLDYLKAAQADIWVSTPSFAEMCLADKEFQAASLNGPALFLFCGETLTVTTAKKLQERFPAAVIINTYGPTESTVAVTETVITAEMCTRQQLPIGRAKPGSQIEIRREDGSLAAEGESGEIVILGDTVSPGYFKLPDKTREVFFTRRQEQGVICGYQTGDIGFWQDGLLYCTGRMNRQIKLHGYRIELQDIEQNLLKLPQINAAVVIPKYKEGKVTSLTAFVTGADTKERPFAYSKSIKELLKEFLPVYMLPKKVIRLNTLPMNTNGKVDQKQLQEMM